MAIRPQIARPLGVIWKIRNRTSGLVVDDAGPWSSQQGQRASVGDSSSRSTVTSVIGSGFETTMDVLRDAETLDLMLFEDRKLLYASSSEPRHTAGGGGGRRRG
jgi:hypothetical protein